jgi:hypothetical protein
VKCVRGWEKIADQFNKQCSRHGSYLQQQHLKTPTELCCRVILLKKQAEKVKFKLEGSPLKESLTLLFKNNKVTIPSLMTKCGEGERPRSRSPTRTAPGSSGPGSSGQYTPHPSASFATPTAATTSYASPTCATPSVAEYQDVNNILVTLGINLKAIPYIVGGITPYEMKGLLLSPEFTRLSFVEDLQSMLIFIPYNSKYDFLRVFFLICFVFCILLMNIAKYFKPQPYQPYQPHDFR